MKRTANLILEVAGGKISSEVADLYPSKIEDFQVFLSYEKMDRLIGAEIPRETVKNIPADDLIRYALSLKHVCCAILGTDSLEILKKNIALIKNFKPLDKKRMEELQVSLSPFYQHRDVEWMQPGYHDGLWA